jgi:hypothetical protein
MRKQAIFDFVKNILPNEFDGKIYWANERKDEPVKPFCLLRAIVPEQTDSTTTETEIENNVQQVTMYKNMVVTFAIFADGIAEKNDLDVQNSFAENNARLLKNNFETFDTAYEFLDNDMSVNNISELRDLTELVSGGYVYRYEFDVTFGFNDVLEIQKNVGKDVKINIVRKTDD